MFCATIIDSPPSGSEHVNYEDSRGLTVCISKPGLVAALGSHHVDLNRHSFRLKASCPQTLLQLSLISSLALIMQSETPSINHLHFGNFIACQFFSSLICTLVLDEFAAI